MPRNSGRKPVGRTGPIEIGAEGISRRLVNFPAEKREREQMIAELFVGNAHRFPDHLAPFSGLVPNDEDDLDFRVHSQEGEKYLELAEFAPLQELDVRYETAPRHFSIGQLATLLSGLVGRKSAHQGRPDCLLLTYKTHDAFLVPPPGIELARRMLNETPPNFSKVYFLSPHDRTGATIFEVFPGVPHSLFEDMSDAQLGAMSWQRFDFDKLA